MAGTPPLGNRVRGTIRWQRGSPRSRRHPRARRIQCDRALADESCGGGLKLPRATTHRTETWKLEAWPRNLSHTKQTSTSFRKLHDTESNTRRPPHIRRDRTYLELRRDSQSPQALFLSALVDQPSPADQAMCPLFPVKLETGATIAAPGLAPRWARSGAARSGQWRANPYFGARPSSGSYQSPSGLSPAWLSPPQRICQSLHHRRRRRDGEMERMRRL